MASHKVAPLTELTQADDPPNIQVDGQVDRQIDRQVDRHPTSNPWTESQRETALQAFRVPLTGRDRAYHWERILDHQRRMVEHSQAAIDVRTAAFDYLLKEGLLNEPVIVERAEQVEADLLAYRDRLTSLHNFGYFDSELRLEVARALRYETSLCLILLDLDNFKRVNDVHGHAEGNEALKEVASVLRKDLRSSDLVARLGGDEFAILLHEADLMTGVKIALDKREAIEQRFRLQTGNDYTVTASLGIAALTGTVRTARGLFDACDKALYHAKNSGRNRCAFPFRDRLVTLSSSSKASTGRRRREAASMPTEKQPPSRIQADRASRRAAG